MVTTSESAKNTAGWSAAQDKITKLSTDLLHYPAATAHAGLVADRLGAATSAAAIDAAIRAIRTGRPVSR